jgi:hypothetical protein
VRRMVCRLLLWLLATQGSCVSVRGALRERNCEVAAVLLSSKCLLGYVSEPCVNGIRKAIGEKSAVEDSDNGKNHGWSEHKVVIAGISDEQELYTLFLGQSPRV